MEIEDGGIYWLLEMSSEDRDGGRSYSVNKVIANKHKVNSSCDLCWGGTGRANVRVFRLNDLEKNFGELLEGYNQRIYCISNTQAEAKQTLVKSKYFDSVIKLLTNRLENIKKLYIDGCVQLGNLRKFADECNKKKS